VQGFDELHPSVRIGRKSKLKRFEKSGPEILSV